MVAAARSLRHAAAIDGIAHLVVHGDGVPLIAAAIDAEPYWAFHGSGCFVLALGARPCTVHVFFLLISLLGPDLKCEGPIKGLT